MSSHPLGDHETLEWGEKLPDHWSVRKLKNLCEVFPSNVDKKVYDGDATVRLCNYTDVYYNDRITDDMALMGATATPAQIERFTLRAGDTIITKDSETADDIAIAAYVPEDLPGVVCGYHLAMVRPRSGVSGAFIKWWFGSLSLKSSVKVRANGLTRVGLSQYDLDNLPVPFPPLGEQVSIASFLDRETAKIDALVEEQRRLIGLLKEKRQTVISHAVTKGLNPNVKLKPSGVEWLGDVPTHWEVMPIRYVARLESGHTPSRARTDWWVDCTVPWFTLADIWQVRSEGRSVITETSEMISELGLANSSARVLPKGTVMLSRTASVGFAAIMGVDMATTQDFANWVCGPRLLNDFLLWTFRAMRPEFERMMMGSTHNTIYMPDIAAFRFALPPLNTQLEVINYLEATVGKIDALIAEATKSEALLLERRSALIAAAVTGAIEVSAAATAEVTA